MMSETTLASIEFSYFYSNSKHSPNSFFKS